MDRLKFRATDDQILQMAANAANASIVMGLGKLHYYPADQYDPSDFKIYQHHPRSLYLDYFQGRMVKLYLMETPDPGVWSTHLKINSEYQSWVRIYPTAMALIESVNAKVVETP